MLSQAEDTCKVTGFQRKKPSDNAYQLRPMQAKQASEGGRREGGWMPVRG